MVLKNGEITDRFQTFVNPNRRLTPEIIGLTGITDDMVRGKRIDERTVAESLVDASLIVAHNAGLTGLFSKNAFRNSRTETGPVR